MSKILVYPSKIIIENYKDGNYKYLMNGLSLWNKARFCYEWNAYLVNEDSEVLIIPRGYSIIKLKLLYKDHEVEYVNHYNIFDKVNLNMNSKPRDDVQIKSLDYLMGINDFDNTKDKNKFLCLKTGSGKTFVTISYICKKDKKTIIFLDNDKMMLQWKKEFLKFTDIKEEEIYMFSGIESFTKIYNDEIEYDDYKIFIASHRSVNNVIKKDITLLDNIFKKIKIGIKVYDEAHVEWKNTFFIESLTNVSESIYLTATPSRSNVQENQIYERMYDSTLQYGLEFKHDEKYNDVIYCYWNSRPDDDHRIRMRNKNYGFNINEYNDYLEQDRFEDFYNNIKILIDKMNKGKKDKLKLALVVQKNSLVKVLSDNLKKDYPDKSIGIFSTIIPDKNKRAKELDKDIIVTTIRSFNKGIDVKGLNVIINTVPISSKTLIEQLIGRLRYIEGDQTLFIDFIDTGFPDYKYQLKSRKGVLDAISKRNFKLIL